MNKVFDKMIMTDLINHYPISPGLELLAEL